MKKNYTITKLLKKSIEKQITNTIDERCIFLCYQPVLPNSIKIKQKKYSKSKV